MTARTSRRPHRVLVLLLLALTGLAALALAACGGDDDEGGATTPAGSPTSSALAGTITITSGEITGQSGKALLVLAMPESGGSPIARACFSITSDSFTPPATVLTDVPSGDDPCAGSTSQTVFTPGSYMVTAGIYQPPAQEPEKDFTVTVAVTSDEPVEVEIDAAELSE